MKLSQINPTAYYMNPSTGSVLRGGEWLEELTEDAELIEVEWKGSALAVYPQDRSDYSIGDWVEVK